MGCRCSRNQLDPRLYLQNLKQNKIEIDSRIEPIYKPSDYQKQQLVDTITKSYYGDESHTPERGIQWVFSKFKGQSGVQSSEQQKEALHFYAKWLVNFSLRNGVVYTIRDQESKEIAGVACMFPPQVTQNYNLFTWRRVMSTFFRGGFCRKYRHQEHPFKTEEFRTYHEETVRGIKQYAFMPHWYLYCVAVNPKYQGQGIGKSFVGLLNQFSDYDKVPAFLQCTGDETINYFQKYGYKTEEVFNYRLKDIADSVNPYKTAFMLRQPSFNSHIENNNKLDQQF